MARAAAVHGIRPKKSFASNASPVISTRLEEMLGFRRALDDATLVSELHDMRIAAKRLRYALEIFETCFDGARPLVKETTEIQEDLGDIHDLDVLAGALRTRLHALEVVVEDEAAAIMSGSGENTDKGKQIRRLLATHARDRRRLGLYGLIGDKVAERRRRYERFKRRWGSGRLDELAESLRRLTDADSAAEEEAQHVALEGAQGDVA